MKRYETLNKHFGYKNTYILKVGDSVLVMNGCTMFDFNDEGDFNDVLENYEYELTHDYPDCISQLRNAILRPRGELYVHSDINDVFDTLLQIVYDQCFDEKEWELLDIDYRTNYAIKETAIWTLDDYLDQLSNYVVGKIVITSAHPKRWFISKLIEKRCTNSYYEHIKLFHLLDDPTDEEITWNKESI